VRPGVPDGTIIDEISLTPSGRVPVIAVTVIRPVILVPELVIKAFEPLITHWPSERIAVVRVPPASEPAPGSVNPKAPSIAPLHMAGRYIFFCSSEPNR